MPKVINDDFYCEGVFGKITHHKAEKHYARGLCRKCYILKYYSTYLQHYRSSEEYKEKRQEYDIKYQLKGDNK